VFVVPLRFGGGTKLKTLEAMAMGLPVVSTAVGAQGLNIISGQHIYVAERPEDFAARVIELMKDHGKAASMGAAARLLVEKQYSWTSIMGDVDDKMKNLFWKRK
jgi:glycosyltransferase involved in cell wall biosynthesis